MTFASIKDEPTLLANELFCNPDRSHSDIFNIICNFKHDIEIIIANKLIKESIIFKTIIKDLKNTYTYQMEWDGYGKIRDEDLKIRYNFRYNKHVFKFVYKKNKKMVNYKFYFVNNGDNNSFNTMLFEELKRNYLLKPLFLSTILLGKRTHYYIM